MHNVIRFAVSTVSVTLILFGCGKNSSSGFSAGSEAHAASVPDAGVSQANGSASAAAASLDTPQMQSLLGAFSLSGAPAASAAAVDTTLTTRLSAAFSAGLAQAMAANPGVLGADAAARLSVDLASFIAAAAAGNAPVSASAWNTLASELAALQNQRQSAQLQLVAPTEVLGADLVHDVLNLIGGALNATNFVLWSSAVQPTVIWSATPVYATALLSSAVPTLTESDYSAAVAPAFPAASPASAAPTYPAVYPASEAPTYPAVYPATPAPIEPATRSDSWIATPASLAAEPSASAPIVPAIARIPCTVPSLLALTLTTANAVTTLGTTELLSGAVNLTSLVLHFVQ